MKWHTLSDVNQIEEIIQESFMHPVAIFKHSTRCSISDIAKGRLDREAEHEAIVFYYLDLLAHRDISNALAERFSVAHESPQVLVLKNGECIFDESHTGITMQGILEQLA